LAGPSPLHDALPIYAGVERLRDEFAASTEALDRKAIAEQLQVRAMEVGTYVPLGEYVTPRVSRREVRGFIEGFYIVFWNVEKQPDRKSTRLTPVTSL